MQLKSLNTVHAEALWGLWKITGAVGWTRKLELKVPLKWRGASHFILSSGVFQAELEGNLNPFTAICTQKDCQGKPLFLVLVRKEDLMTQREWRKFLIFLFQPFSPAPAPGIPRVEGAAMESRVKCIKTLGHMNPPSVGGTVVLTLWRESALLCFFFFSSLSILSSLDLNGSHKYQKYATE